MERKVIWLTASYFLDVDLPIVSKLAGELNIEWYILYDNVSHKKKYMYKGVEANSFNIKSKWYSPFILWEYLNFFKSLKYNLDDIIYIDVIGMPYLYPLLKFFVKHNNIIIAAHNLKTPKGARFEMLSKLYMKFLINNFSNIHVFSKNQLDYLESLLLSKNILLAPLALKFYGEKISTANKRCKTFLSFGHIRDYKRLDLLIFAAQLAFEETNFIFKVIIAGNCKNWSDYQKLIKYDFLFDIKIGHISNNEVPAIISESDYLVLPYQDIAQSGVLSLAFCYNVPVIVSDIDGFTEFVKDGYNGFLFERDNIVSLKNTIINCLFLKEDSYSGISENIRNYCKNNFDIDSICNKYLDYFNKF